MKAEDLGFNTETGTHSAVLTRAESVFVGILWLDHVGSENKISAHDLAVRFDVGINHPSAELDSEGVFWETRPNGERGILSCKINIEDVKRDVRDFQNHLLFKHDKLPVYSKSGPNGGYWIGATAGEGDAFFETFRQRGMTGMFKATRGKKAGMVDMMQQLTFEFDELVDNTPYAGFVRRRVSDPTPIDVVDAFLERMMSNPEKFADGLRKIGKKYGGVLLPKEQLAALQAKTDELSALMDGLRIGG